MYPIEFSIGAITLTVILTAIPLVLFAVFDQLPHHGNDSKRTCKELFAGIMGAFAVLGSMALVMHLVAYFTGWIYLVAAWHILLGVMILCMLTKVGLMWREWDRIVRDQRHGIIEVGAQLRSAEMLIEGLEEEIEQYRQRYEPAADRVFNEFMDEALEEAKKAVDISSDTRSRKLIRNNRETV